MQTNDLEYEWGIPPPSYRLSADGVHVWRISLNSAPASQLDRLWHLLSEDEAERAQRYLLQKDRDRFVVTRGTLRLLLGRYSCCEPHDVEFTYNPHGKPSLEKPVCLPTLSFNLSHAGELALVAITHRRKVGIDVEVVRDDVDYMRIAENFFSKREYEMLQTVPSQQKRAAFYNAWTRKEAYTKARGEGLALLKTVEVTLMPGEPAEIVATSDDPVQAKLWSLRQLIPGIHYVGALAVEGHDWRLSCFQW